MLALGLIYDEGSRSDAARLGNVALQIIRDWVMRFNERGPEGLINGKTPGRQSRLNGNPPAN
ncbi:helix-turn-helix domain-containing protein [Agrobacterium bohemicum]|uniref:helix-turn-helix domain-containing protein n=1 Tax=Agrobacterium bohemicum TaxID=2052828 RepID=UPI0009E962E7|nr:helix-turn-helix domain-containing protein [Agrobacterium bohemicum]